MICKRFHPPDCPNMVCSADTHYPLLSEHADCLSGIKSRYWAAVAWSLKSFHDVTCWHVTFSGHMKLWSVTIMDKIWGYQQFLIDLWEIKTKQIWSRAIVWTGIEQIYVCFKMYWLEKIIIIRLCQREKKCIHNSLSV